MMKDETLVDKVKKQFSFLESDFSFKLSFEKDSNLRPHTDGIVKYTSDTTLLIIDSETGKAAVRFSRIQDDENYYLDPVTIHEYLNTSDEEKIILLSKKTEDREAADSIFRKTFLLELPSWKSSREGTFADLEKRLQNYANWLNGNADLCLMGNFSQWIKLYEYKIHRLIADELRRGAANTVLTVIKDENGYLKTVRQPIFHKDLEHIAKLKNELSNK